MFALRIADPMVAWLTSQCVPCGWMKRAATAAPDGDRHPTPGPGKVLIRACLRGCRTDLHVVDWQVTDCR